MIKNLIENIAIMENPLFIGASVLSREFPHAKNICSLLPKTAKIKKKYIRKGLYDGIEYGLWSSNIFDDNWNIDHLVLKKIKSQHSPLYTFHGCFETFPESYRGIYFNLAENNPYTKKSICAQLQVVKQLKKYSPTILVFHGGYVKNKENIKEGINNIISNLSLILDEAKNNNIIITLENNVLKSKYCLIGQTSKELLYIINRVNHPNLKITFDWGHLNTTIADKKFCFSDNVNFSHINNFINECSKLICHAHIHYNLSHCSNHNYKKEKFEKLSLKFLSFLKIVKYQKSGIDDPNDLHMPLTFIANKYRKPFKKSMKLLLQKSNIKNIGYVTHELIPKRIFHFFNLSRYGVDFKDHQKNLYLFNKFIN